ncbi:hypothetical protein D3C86_1359620 [compost metagenome]
MAEHDRQFVPLAHGGVVDLGEVIHIDVGVRHDHARTAAGAMAAMIIGAHPQAEPAQQRHHVRVAPAVLGQAVYQQQRAERLGVAVRVGQPGAHQQLGAVAHALAGLGRGDAGALRSFGAGPLVHAVHIVRAHERFVHRLSPDWYACFFLWECLRRAVSGDSSHNP